MSDEGGQKKFRVIEYPFHLGDLIGGTAHLTNAQFGAYMRLLLASIQAEPDGIPVKKIQAYSCYNGRHFAEFWELIKDKFVEESGIIHNKRVRKTVCKLSCLSAQNRANRLKRNNPAPTTAQRNDNDRATNHLSIYPSNLDKEDPLKVFKIDFMLKDDDREAAREQSRGWDQHELMRKYDEWVNAYPEKRKPQMPGAAYIAWCKSFTKGKKP